MICRYTFAALVAAGMLTQPVFGAPYTIDSSLSSLNLEATVTFGESQVSLQGQDATSPTGNPLANDVVSKTTALEGTIEATASASLITLDLNTSVINAMLNPNADDGSDFFSQEGGVLALGDDEIFADGTVDPDGDGDSLFSVGEDNFGYQIDLGLFGVAVAAARNIILTGSGSGIPNDGLDDTGIGFNISNGWLAFEIPTTGDASEEDQTNVDDGPDFNQGGQLLYSLVGTTETLTIPIDILIVDLADGDTTSFFGVIVASRTVTLGDFNGDDVVDGVDFLVWQRGAQDPGDLADWEANYGNGVGALSAGLGAVPEPSSLALLNLALGLLVLRRDRSCTAGR